VADVLARLRSSLVRPLLVVVAACLLLPVPTLVLGSGVAYALEVGGSLGALAALAVALVAGARWLLASPERAERLLDLPFGRDVDRWTLTTVLEGTLRAGTPPAEVLERLREASVTPARRARFEAARGVLSRGGTFTDAVSLLGVFDATARLQVRAGEESGTLDDVFDGLARTAGEQLERRLALASKLVTFAVSMLTLALIGLRVLAAYQGVLGGEQKLLDEIEAEMPIRALDGLKLR